MNESNINTMHMHHLQPEMVEEILFRLPVKSLIRFRSVCKQWKRKISDDARFADARLRVSRNSARTLVLVYSYHRPPDDVVTTHQVQVSDNHLRAVDHPPTQSSFDPRHYKTLCHCDGIHLINFSSSRHYVLWNPSNGTYKQLSYPYYFPAEYRTNNIFGICYDPTVINNYKVVIGSADGYAVFNCTANSWSKMRRKATLFSEYDYAGFAASLQGSVYWVFSTAVYNKDNDDRCQIVCFDGRDEELKCVRKFKGVCELDLVSSPEAVYVFRNLTPFGCSEMEVRKIRVADKDEDEDEDVKVVRAPSFIYPKCWIHPDNILFEEPLSPYTGSFSSTIML